MTGRQIKEFLDKLNQSDLDKDVLVGDYDYWFYEVNRIKFGSCIDGRETEDGSKDCILIS